MSRTIAIRSKGKKVKMRYVVNEPVVACIITNDDKVKVRGVARCRPNDEFNERTGRDIARLKAEIKLLRKDLKPADEALAALVVYVDGIRDKIYGKLKELDEVFETVKEKSVQ